MREGYEGDDDVVVVDVDDEDVFPNVAVVLGLEIEGGRDVGGDVVVVHVDVDDEDVSPKVVVVLGLELK